ncbi:MAG: hypothetical protein OXU83_06450 [Gammaproteobacteria bacterium]|nr:hypothetical protein [Gammaproteobacteria bacterium]
MEQQQANAVTLAMTPEAVSAMLSAMYAKDADFRAAFDKDPKAAIAKVTGQKMAPDAKVVVHRNEDKCLHITLPSQEAMSLMSDQDISGVSGGTRAGPATFFNCIVGPLLVGSGLCDCCSGTGGTALSDEDAATVTTAMTTLTDAYAGLFGAVASIAASGGGSGGTP